MSARKKSETTEWSIGDFYNQAWDLTWNNKKLWILGLAVSIYAAGGGSGSGNSFDASDFQNFQQNQQQQQELPESPYSDLVEDAGAQESDELPTLESKVEGKADLAADALNPLAEGFNRVSGGTLALLVLEGLAFGLLALVLGFFLAAWSQASLIQGVADAAHAKKIDLFKISNHAITRVKPMVWLMIVPGLKFVLATFVIAIGGAIGIALLAAFAPRASVLGVFVVLAGIIWFVYALAHLLAALAYALRSCVLDNNPGKEAYDAGYAIAKGNIWKTFRLGTANVLVAALVGMLAAMPIIGVGIATVARDLMRESISFWTFVPVVITSIVAMPIMFLIGGILKVFVFGTWHFAFTTLKNLKAQV